MSVSGLSLRQQAKARHLVLVACRRLLQRPADVHYTQNADRWDGITHRKMLHKSGFWPFHGDCSSTATWVLWRALAYPFGLKDIVNGADWKAGFTGTIAAHGRQVRGPRRVGDLVLYGPPPTYEHVAVYVGGGKVMSHGSEAGPFLLPVNYRPDVGETRRFI